MEITCRRLGKNFAGKTPRERERERGKGKFSKNDVGSSLLQSRMTRCPPVFRVSKSKQRGIKQIDIGINKIKKSWTFVKRWHDFSIKKIFYKSILFAKNKPIRGKAKVEFFFLFLREVCLQEKEKAGQRNLIFFLSLKLFVGTWLLMGMHAEIFLIVEFFCES